MRLPLFKEETLTSCCSDLGIGQRFQRFVADIFSVKYEGLHPYNSGGKDGAIDLSYVENGKKIFVECKHVGSADFRDIKDRWNEVARHLNNNLTPPDKPGESQYTPWYDPANAPHGYRLCVSCSLRTEHDRNTLTNEIRKTFKKLAAHSHLSHLNRIETVEILCHDDFETKLESYPHLYFRWFHEATPQGLSNFAEEKSAGALRSYLSGEKLPYYAIDAHLTAHPLPEEASFKDEEALLDMLARGDEPGIIIYGTGGVGKTRLTYEIGRRAIKRDWFVFRVKEGLDIEGLRKLRGIVPKEGKVLLLIDYLETFEKFGKIVEAVEESISSSGCNIYFVANCRSRYYNASRLESYSHWPVSLSPSGSNRDDDLLKQWLEEYRIATVNHILRECGVVAIEKAAQEVRSSPILAVFVAYLNSREGDGAAEFHQLLEVRDFSKWLSKRLELSFKRTDVVDDLGRLMPLFPMTPETRNRLDEPANRLVCTLVEDGWIEQEEERWRVIHDVLADRIAELGCPVGDERNHFTRLFANAARLDSLPSVIVSVQRLLDNDRFTNIDWHGIVTTVVAAADSEPWEKALPYLLRSTILNMEQQIDFLFNHKEWWRDAETEPELLSTLVLAVRARQNEENESWSEDRVAYLIDWFAKASEKAVAADIDSAITAGLLLAPDRFETAAMTWIMEKPHDFHTHYVLTAFLWKLPNKADQIRENVIRWINANPFVWNCTYLFRAWLEATKDGASVKAPLLRWLEKHGEAPTADFVYKAWLKATKDGASVKEPLLRWLDKHSLSPGAGFVYLTWIDAGGDFATIKKQAFAWLAHNPIHNLAGELIRHAKRKGAIPDETIRPMLQGIASRLNEFKRQRNHRIVLSSLIAQITSVKAAGMANDIALRLLSPLLTNGNIMDAKTREGIIAVIVQITENLNFLKGGNAEKTERLIIAGLRHPALFGANVKCHNVLQRKEFIEYVITLLECGALDENDREDEKALKRLAAWIGVWEPTRKKAVKEDIELLKNDYPGNRIWDDIRY